MPFCIELLFASRYLYLSHLLSQGDAMVSVALVPMINLLTR